MFSEERKASMASIRALLETAKDHIRIKQLRIQKSKGSNDFKTCDDLSSQMKDLLKEKAQLESQLSVLERKEAKSRWHIKRKTLENKESKEANSAESFVSVKDMLIKPTVDNSSSQNSSDTSGASADTLILDSEESDNSPSKDF